jgi:hypothetical protein
VEAELKNQYKVLSQNFTSLATVIQYMKTNKLVRVRLADLNDLNAFTKEAWDPTSYIVHSGNILTSINIDGSLLKPLMLVTQAQCDGEAKFDIQLRLKDKPNPVAMYRLHHDPKTSLAGFSFDQTSTGIHVFMLNAIESGKSWELVFNTPVSNQLDTFKVTNVKNDFSMEGEAMPKTTVRLKSGIHCEVPFEPFIVAQSIPELPK